MSRQVLGGKWMRRIARATGAEVFHASANGGYWHSFTTVDHRHGDIHATTYEVKWNDTCPGLTSCRRRWGTQ